MGQPSGEAPHIFLTPTSALGFFCALTTPTVHEQRDGPVGSLSHEGHVRPPTSFLDFLRAHNSPRCMSHILESSLTPVTALQGRTYRNIAM